jgi:SpoIID/LytB domain protein
MTRSGWLAVFALIAMSGCKRAAPPATSGPGGATAASSTPSPAIEPLASIEVLHHSAWVAFALSSDAKGRPVEAHHEDWLDADVLPGSIAKLATLSEALRRGVLQPTTRIACTRRLTLADGRRADCSHPPAFESLDVTEAIAQSCNVFAATVARRLSPSDLSSAFVAMGLRPLAADEDPVAAALGLGRSGTPARRLVDVLRRALDGPPAIRDGLALAAARGTASAFGRAGLTAFAKTGTSQMSNGRSLGLTVAAAPLPTPTHVAVVLVPGASGADAAGVAAHLLRSIVEPSRPRVRVGRALKGGAYDVVSVDLEDYVAEVVSGETPAETPPAAREAVAVAARTFALANRDRHRADGFDLCELTHCQVVRPADPGAGRAAQATRGRVLRAGDAVAPVFYSAACGGTLDAAPAVAGDLGAIRGLPWTRARPDPAGADEPEWRTVIEAGPLERTLRAAGFRGDALVDLRVDTNAEGRVRRVRVSGLTPETMAIDDFRRLVGPDLGWNVVRSTRFEVHRTARGFELRGRGHGHGVGLCVLGAGRLARRGATVDEILAAYFPGLTSATLDERARSPQPSPRTEGAAFSRATTAVRLHLPAAAEPDRTSLTALIERTLAALARTAGVARPASLEVVVHPTVQSYQRATGRPWWTSAAARQDEGRWIVDTIPLESLRRGGRLETTLRHELAHVLIDSHLSGRPLWVREGLAMHFAGETMSPANGSCPPDAEFRGASTRDAMADVYRRAATCAVKALAAGARWTELGAQLPAAR